MSSLISTLIIANVLASKLGLAQVSPLVRFCFSLLKGSRSRGSRGSSLCARTIFCPKEVLFRGYFTATSPLLRSCGHSSGSRGGAPASEGPLCSCPLELHPGTVEAWSPSVPGVCGPRDSVAAAWAQGLRAADLSPSWQAHQCVVRWGGGSWGGSAVA